MSDQLDIVVTSIDAAASEAAQRLAQAFDLSTVEAEQFVRELPRVAKRNASREEAARYVEALKAIGARVETLASEGPRETMRARMLGGGTDQLVIPVEEPPAMRFRATGDLGMISVPPHEVLHPSIPKAPLIPRDLNRMPNGGLPMPSIRPAAGDELDALDAAGEPRRHTDAQLPPPLVLAARQLGASPAAAAEPAPAAAPSPAPQPQTAPDQRPMVPAVPAVAASEHTQQGQSLTLKVGVALLLLAAAIALARFVL